VAAAKGSLRCLRGRGLLRHAARIIALVVGATPRVEVVARRMVLRFRRGRGVHRDDGADREDSIRRAC
jgi:hypothetical protein